METEKMFEQASRLKLRYESNRGLLSVEDLWDLPLTGNLGSSGNRVNLDSIAIALHKLTKNSADTVSFVTPNENKDQSELLLKFELVKHVIAVRVRERNELQQAAERREKKQRLLELIAQKEDQSLAEKSIDELRALAESL